MALIAIEIEKGNVTRISTIVDTDRSGAIILDHSRIAKIGKMELDLAFGTTYEIVTEGVDLEELKDTLYFQYNLPRKKKFIITAKTISYSTMEVEVEDEDEAWDIANEADGSEFSPVEKGDSWEIDRVELKENE